MFAVGTSLTTPLRVSMKGSRPASADAVSGAMAARNSRIGASVFTVKRVSRVSSLTALDGPNATTPEALTMPSSAP